MSDLLSTGLKKLDNALAEKEKEHLLWRPMLFHLFASLEMDRFVYVSQIDGVMRGKKQGERSTPQEDI